MIDLMLEDAGREVDSMIDGLFNSALEEVRASLHELVGILERDLEEVRAALHEDMPVSSNTFPPLEVWS